MGYNNSVKRIGNNMKYSPAPRRAHWNEMRAWPVIKTALLAAAVIALVLLAARFGVPWLAERFSARGTQPQLEQAEPTAAQYLPNPLAVNAAQAVVFSGVSAPAAIDPSVYGGQVLFAAGEAANACDRLVRYDPASGACEQIDVELENGSVRRPVEDARAIAYLDAAADGGGRVMWMDKADGACREIARYASGVPALCLEYPYLVWTARTSDTAASLYVYDAVSGETAAVAIFDDTPYAFSAPSLRSGQLLYADASEKSAETSRIRTILLASGDRFDYEADVYVHDPASNGNRWAFLAGDHGPDADLYLCTDGGAPKRIAHGAINFGVTPTCLVFGRDETVYAYAFGEDKTYVLSGTGAAAQFVTAGGEYAVWRDVSDPAKPVYRVMRLV